MGEGGRPGTGEHVMSTRERLSPANQQKLREWLKTHCQHMRCPGCGGSNWQYDDLVGVFCGPEPTRIDFTPVDAALIRWMVPVECASCHCTILFRAGRLGITAPQG